MTRPFVARNIVRLFFILVISFLLIPWCFAVPPLTIVIVPIYIKLLRKLTALTVR